MRLIPLAPLTLALLLPGLAAAASPSVTDAFSRATPGAGPGAAYFTIHGGDTPDRLLGVSSTAAQKIEMHSMTMQGDVMRMREVEAIDVPAHGTVKLAPGAEHLMLMGLQAPLKPGDSVQLTLRIRACRRADRDRPGRRRRRQWPARAAADGRCAGQGARHARPLTGPGQAGLGGTEPGARVE